jgi:NTE family protein
VPATCKQKKISAAYRRQKLISHRHTLIQNMGNLRWICALGVISTLFAQTPAAEPAGSRPRIGLVLEGGGALGFAHIGVLEYLEQHHIPVNYLVGTSMGGLVAGLYASGYSPAQIRQLTNEINWDAVLIGKIPFQDLSYRRKEDREAYPNRLEFGLKNGIALPSGLNSGQQVGLILDRAVLPYYDLKTFDELPIPFRCVATNLTTGKERVFDSGPLSQALRATMSIPAVFSPVMIDGNLYTDGGAVNNFPVDVAKKMGSDIVIGVYLDPGPPNPKEYYSFLTIAGRNISIMIAANELKGIEMTDVLLTADLRGFTSSSFKDGAKIIPKGAAAAEKKQHLLAKFAVDQDTWDHYVADRQSRIKTKVPVPEFIQVSGIDSTNTEAVKQNLAPYVGKPLEPPQLEKSLIRLTGLGLLSSLDYSMTKKNDKAGLEIRAAEKDYGPPFLNLGITIDGSDINDIRFGMAGRLTLLNVGGFRSEWRTDAFFGSTYGVTSEYYRPFSEQSKWFYAPHAYATSALFDVYQDQDRLSQYRQIRNGLGVDLGYAINQRSEVRLGQDIGWYSTTKKIGVEIVPNSNQTLGITSVRYQYLGVDDTLVPRNGGNVLSKMSWFSDSPGGGSYPSAELNAGYFRAISKPASVFGTVSAGTTFGTSTESLQLQSFTLGGPLRLGAYGRNELLGNQYFLFQGGYLRELFPLNPLIGESVYGLAFFEIGKVFDSPAGPSLPLDGSLALVAKTAFGPVYVGGSIGSAGHRKWWFGVGRVF